MFDEENEETPREEAPEEEAPQEEPTTEEPAATEELAAEEPAAEEPAPAEEEPAPAEEEPAPAEEEPAPAEEEPAAVEEQPAAPEEPAAPEPPKRERKKDGKPDEPEVIPGADLEPDLVLEEARQDREGVGEGTAAVIEAAEESLPTDDGEGGETDEPAPAVTSVLEMAADARYNATGKRKRAIARVTLKPGTGAYLVNGRTLDEFFPRPTLQRTARGPLETVGQQERMDVVAKVHGGGVSSQAGALRHGITKALVEADPALRGELKRRGYLTRDPRVKERKKAGLKKARKRPQFSKR